MKGTMKCHRSKTAGRDRRPADCGAGRRCAFGQRRWRTAAILLIVLSAGAILLGCGTEEKRYRLLAFFFDGVPVPESLRAELGDQTDEPVNPFDARSASARTPKAAEIEYVYHRPYAQRDCFGCHDRQRGFGNMAADSQMCGSCHQAYFTRQKDDWMHGPALLGQCRLCHEPHKSPNEGLLTTAQPQICYTCHERAFVVHDPFHSKLDDLTCSNCHDPHAAGNHQLLVDGRSFSRNRNAARRVGSKHPDWSVQQCSLCHIAEQSNRLIENVNGMCLTCHENQRTAPEGRTLHQPVKDGECIRCHTPHASVRPHLLRPQAEQLCVGCHKLEDVNSPKHPKVTRVDCTMCHQGHWAERDHLLRRGIDVPAEERSSTPARPEAQP